MLKIDTKKLRYDLCSRLAAAIEKRQLDVDSLAAEIGIRPNNLCRVLAGRYDFGIDVFLSLCSLLRCDINLYLRV